MSQRHPIQTGATMFVTTNVQNRRPLFLNPAYAREAIETLYRTQLIHPFTLFGFVIMPDHCHLLLLPEANETISKIIRVFKGGVSHNLGIGPIWQPRFYLKTSNDGHKLLNYIHLNPSRDGLVKDPFKYPWSSINENWPTCPVEY